MEFKTINVYRKDTKSMRADFASGRGRRRVLHAIAVTAPEFTSLCWTPYCSRTEHSMSLSLYIYIISLILLSLSLLLAKCALLGHPVLCHQKVMVFFVTCSLRRWALRGIWTAILVLGLCQAAKVNKAVYYDLPHDPIHWNRHLTMVRSLLGSQSLSLKYIPAGSSSTPGYSREREREAERPGNLEG